MSVMRLGYANLRVIDLEAAIHHYVDLIGLRLIEHDSERRAYLQCVDSQDHHCLVLTESERPGLDHAGYKVNDPADLAAIHGALQERGIEARRVPASALNGQGEGIRFKAPSGHEFLLYYHADKVGYAAGMRDPDPVSFMPRTGAGHLDHMVLSCERPWEFATFMCELLGFYVTEQVNAADGNAVVSFLSCSNTMHDLAITPGPNEGFHHIAFVVESRSAVVEKADLLKQNKSKLMEYGLSRHGIAGVTTSYVHDPSGNWNEICNGAYLAAGVGGRVPPIVWGPEAMDRALFYYEGAAPNGFFSVT